MNLSIKYGELLPPLTTDEFESLKTSIKKEGVRDPIIIDENGVILDGHHRYKIDTNAPTIVISGLTDLEKKAFVFNSNLTRRNLSPFAINNKSCTEQEFKQWAEFKMPIKSLYDE